ncbi:TIGR03987 family protein [Ktedonosporobacter rubrisoli]|uniref:TIGR03987 family protein n=1 Tax=Ktedonosporobacter rubrisoli TaxID=2509675 RepID=A0A4P6K197_KTERU|nr:HsmA family protein [Ktedonosporobacter rubrisoli]QBD81592.1 TIGR03987 family protein [Ktedonosporobacter rubrisoli]
MPLLPLAIVAMTTALVLYSIGVWSERLVKHLKPWHLFFFWGGLVFDGAGTEMMHLIAGGKFVMSLHSMTGAVALLLMAIHTLWASIVVWRKRPNELQSFHRLSLIVWTLWLIPYGTGAVLNSGLLG